MTRTDNKNSPSMVYDQRKEADKDKELLNPLHINYDNWIYSNKSGSLDLVHRVYYKGDYVQTDIIHIPPRKVKAIIKGMK